MYHNIVQLNLVDNSIFDYNKYHHFDNHQLQVTNLDIQDRLQLILFLFYNQAQANLLYIQDYHSRRNENDQNYNHLLQCMKYHILDRKNLVGIQFRILYHKFFKEN